MANFCACPPENSIQYGTHDELVKDKGNEYETMYSAQAQYYV